MQLTKSVNNILDRAMSYSNKSINICFNPPVLNGRLPF